jgi:hypothetical protein
MKASVVGAVGVALVLVVSAVGLVGCKSGQGEAPSEDAVKRYITRKEEALATGVGSSHASVTVTFESVRMGESRAATEKDRVVNGITGSTVFPVRAKYASLRRWGNGETQTVNIHYSYEFYRDEFGEWNAYYVGPVN